MQNRRGDRELRDPFDMFSGGGNFGGFGGSHFGRSPFDDPFFTRPFGSMFDRRSPMENSRPVIPQNEPVIQELASDDDDDGGEEMEKGVILDNEPFVDHPDDETDGKPEHRNYRTDYNRDEGTQAQTFKVHSCKVTYGGVDGAYYTSSSTKRMGSDGVIMEDCKEADKTTGEATHRISRGLQDKGHSITRKLNWDGKVETSQKLHNMNEDELGSFEEAWKGNSGMHLPPWTGLSNNRANTVSNWGGLLLPSVRNVEDSLGRGHSNQSKAADVSSTGRAKNVIRIPID